ncbi:MAG TPA: hypothetical protein VI488_17850 [Candidatus Angelobacter sp.]
MNADALFARLDRCIEAANPNTTIQVILELENIRTERFQVPDEILDRMLTLLQTKAVLESPVAATVLAFFSVACITLTKAQRRRCLSVLRTLADKFSDGDALYEANQLYDRLLIAQD